MMKQVFDGAAMLACALVACTAICAPAWAVDVRRADGVEIISGRPAQAAATPASRAPARAATGATGRDPAAPESLAGSGMQGGQPRADGASSVVPDRLRAAEAVLQDQISAYNRALLDDAGPAVLSPLEAAIGRTLEHIETLVRTARQPEP